MTLSATLVGTPQETKVSRQNVALPAIILKSVYIGSTGELATERSALKIQRQALRGLARAAAARGDQEAARRLHARMLGPAARPARSVRAPAANPLAAFEHILGATALDPSPVPEQAPEEATPPDAEHWAHGDYGWFLFEEGEYEVRPTAFCRLHSAHPCLSRLPLCP